MRKPVRLRLKLRILVPCVPAPIGGVITDPVRFFPLPRPSVHVNGSLPVITLHIMTLCLLQFTLTFQLLIYTYMYSREKGVMK